MLLCVEVCDVCLTVTNAGGEVAGICLGGRRSVLASRPWLGGIGGLGFFPCGPVFAAVVFLMKSLLESATELWR